MQLKTYTFLLRKNGTLRCIPNTLWQQLLQRKQALSNTEAQQLTIGEIQIDSGAIQQVRSWEVCFNPQGFIEQLTPQRLPCPRLNVSLDQLFPLGGAGMEQLMTDFIDDLVKEDADVCAVGNGRR